MILFQYIRRMGRHYALLVTLSVATLLLAIEWLLQFPSLQGDYGSLQAMLYALFLLPRNLYAVSPLLVVATLLFMYMREQGRGEWLGCLITGLPYLRIHRWLMLVMLTFVVGWSVLGEGFAPLLTMRAKRSKMLWLHHQPLLVASQGLWLSDAKGMVYVDFVQGNKIGRSVWYHPVAHGMDVYVANRVSYVHQAWLADEAQKLMLRDQEAKIVHEQAKLWPIRLPPKAIKFSMRSPSERPWVELWKHATDQESRYLCWARLFFPIWLLILSKIILLILPRAGEPLKIYHWAKGFSWIVLMLIYEQIHALLFPYLPMVLVACLPIILYSLVMMKMISKE